MANNRAALGASYQQLSAIDTYGTGTAEADFSKPDTPDCIVYKNETKTEIKSCTMEKAVEKLTADLYYCPIDREVFLLTYTNYAKPIRLVNLLIARYYCSVRDENQSDVRQRVLGLLEYWITNFPGDFVDPLSSLTGDKPDTLSAKKTLEKFMEGILKDDRNPIQVQILLSSLVDGNVYFGASNWLKDFESSLERTANSHPDEERMSVFDYSALEIAQQITLLDWQLWEKITSSEFNDLGWTRANKDILSPNVNAMVNRFNEVSDRLATSLLIVKKLKERVRIYCKLLDIADCLKDMGNFNGFMMVMAALQRGPVQRLRKTLMSLGDKDTLNRQLFSIVECANHVNMRTLMKSREPPLISYLGMHLTDILFLMQGSPDVVNGQINYVKMTRYAELLKLIQFYQKSERANGYNFPANANLQRVMRAMPCLPENSLYDLSSVIEPREGKEVTLSPDLVAVLNQHNPTGKKESILRVNPSSARENERERERLERERERLERERLALREPTEAELDGAKTVLLTAAWEGNVKEIIALTEDTKVINAIINRTNDRGQSALYSSARQGHTQIVSLLLSIPGVEVNYQIPLGSTALHAASYNDWPDCVALLLCSGADSLTIKNNANLSPRQEAKKKAAAAYHDWENLAFDEFRKKYPIVESLSQFKFFKKMKEEKRDMLLQSTIGRLPLGRNYKPTMGPSFFTQSHQDDDLDSPRGLIARIQQRQDQSSTLSSSTAGVNPSTLSSPRPHARNPPLMSSGELEKNKTRTSEPPLSPRGNQTPPSTPLSPRKISISNPITPQGEGSETSESGHQNVRISRASSMPNTGSTIKQSSSRGDIPNDAPTGLSNSQPGKNQQISPTGSDGELTSPGGINRTTPTFKRNRPKEVALRDVSRDNIAQIGKSRTASIAVPMQRGSKDNTTNTNSPSPKDSLLHGSSGSPKPLPIPIPSHSASNNNSLQASPSSASSSTETLMPSTVPRMLPNKRSVVEEDECDAKKPGQAGSLHGSDGEIGGDNQPRHDGLYNSSTSQERQLYKQSSSASHSGEFAVLEPPVPNRLPFKSREKRSTTDASPMDPRFARETRDRTNSPSSSRHARAGLTSSYETLTDGSNNANATTTPNNVSPGKTISPALTESPGNASDPPLSPTAREAGVHTSPPLRTLEHHNNTNSVNANENATPPTTSNPSPTPAPSQTRVAFTRSHTTGIRPLGRPTAQPGGAQSGTSPPQQYQFPGQQQPANLLPSLLPTSHSQNASVSSSSGSMGDASSQSGLVSSDGQGLSSLSAGVELTAMPSGTMIAQPASAMGSASPLNRHMERKKAGAPETLIVSPRRLRREQTDTPQSTTAQGRDSHTFKDLGQLEHTQSTPSSHLSHSHSHPLINRHSSPDNSLSHVQPVRRPEQYSANLVPLPMQGNSMTLTGMSMSIPNLPISPKGYQASPKPNPNSHASPVSPKYNPNLPSLSPPSQPIQQTQQNSPSPSSLSLQPPVPQPVNPTVSNPVNLPALPSLPTVPTNYTRLQPQPNPHLNGNNSTNSPRSAHNV